MDRNATGSAVHDPPSVTTFLFTDIEGSTRLWEQQPERMRRALERHDALCRSAVEAHRGLVVKTTGDGIHAAFADPRDAVAAALHLQLALADPQATDGLAIRVRCGLHAGAIERRDNDYFGTVVNRAARIMAIAHGGQTIASQAVADLARDRLPTGASLRDLGVARLRDLSGSERVFQLDHPSLRSEFPALRSLESTPNNLPQQLTTFVGREREIAQAGQLLRSARLLTLCGAGGLGKTRLSLQLAADALSHFPDGVWFVDLAPIADERLVPQAIASVLGVKEDAGRPVSEALLRFVQDRELLLILDNCEHLVEACAQMATQLLQASACIRILATSRESLRVHGETTYPMPVLGVPSSGPTTASAIGTCEAVRLFVDRATAVQPSFELTDRNAPAIVDICRRLDGIPLALELAAARLRAMSVDAIAARLGDLFRLLARGDRTALPRQQTLRALIDWSHDLLTPAEQVLFRRLSVFAGGWTLEAAEAVCADGDIRREDVLDPLSALVDKSLVVLDAESGRYRLLETVRQYGEERLESAQEERATRSRHLAYFVSLTEALRPKLAGASGAGTMRRLDQDRENILAAHHWALQSDVPPDFGYRLVHAVKPYWFSRSLSLGYRLTVEALSRRDVQPSSGSRAYVLYDAAQMCAYGGRYDDALRFLEECLPIASAFCADDLLPDVFQYMAYAELGRGNTVHARRHSSASLELARKNGNPLQIAGACVALAQLNRADGDLDGAEALYSEALTLGRNADNTEYIAAALLNLAMVAVAREQPDTASALLLEVFAIAEQAGSRHLAVTALDVSAALASLERQWIRAATLSAVADVQGREIGLQRDPADDAFLQPRLAMMRSALDAQAFASATTDAATKDYEATICETRRWLSDR